MDLRAGARLRSCKAEHGRRARGTGFRGAYLARFGRAALVAVFAGGPALGQAPLHYMRPPEEIAHALEAPSPPMPFVSPTGAYVALLNRAHLPPIAELAEPMLEVGGERIDPRNNGQSRFVAFDGLTLRSTSDTSARGVALPANARISAPSWSPDGLHFAFLLTRDDGVELWAAEATTGRARRLAQDVNAAIAGAFDWLPDSSGLIVRLVPEDRGAAPQPPRVPAGPVIRDSEADSSIGAAPARTPYALALSAYYLSSQLARVPVAGEIRAIGSSAIIRETSVSPDGRFLLQVREERSAGELVRQTVVTDLAGRTVYRFAMPAGGARAGSSTVGARSIVWRADAPATLVWAEAKASGGDRLYALAAPFAGAPSLLLDTKDHYVTAHWGRRDVALIETRSATRHRTIWVAIDPSHPDAGRPVPQTRQGRFQPVTASNRSGQQVLRLNPSGSAVLVAGQAGDHPYLSWLDLRTGEARRLWTSQSDRNLRIEAVIGDDARRLIVRAESRTDPPNLFVLDRVSGTWAKLTDFADPMPQYAGIQRRVLAYDRADGVHLGGTLYLPAGYDRARDGPLPMLMWAYPTDYASASAVGRIGSEPNIFVRPRGLEPPLLLLARGYAIFEPRMPIVGSAGAAPNDSYVAQLVDDARAAVDAVVDLGVARPDRIAIGGHSYGAAMVANLLAYTDLFRTGVAMSGAYNRTLTPFGFQTEHRTFWQAPEDYLAMSPLIHADRINEPLLLIHGGDDPKNGTTPMQSERLYEALQGLGGTVRYVMLPFEGHSYGARQSVMHAFWEISRWLDRHLDVSSGAEEAPDAGPAHARTF